MKLFCRKSRKHVIGRQSRGDISKIMDYDLWRINVKFLIVTTVFKTAVTSATNQLDTNGQRLQIDIEQICNLF